MIPLRTGFVVLTASALIQTVALAEPSSASEASTEWQRIKTLCNPALIPAPPESWEKEPPSAEAYEEWREAERKELTEIAQAAEDFRKRHPDHAHASSALILGEVVSALMTNLDAAVGEGGGKPISGEDIRYLRLSSFMLCKARTPEALASTAQRLKAKHPRQQAVYHLLLSAAAQLPPKEARKLAEEVTGSEYADESTKTIARKMIATFERIGKPLEMSFTTLDGATINTADWKGKVVLIDFRITQGKANDLSSLDALKKAYSKHHSAGLEVVTVALADDAESLKNYATEAALPWPHHFDGRLREGGKLRTEYEVVYDSNFYLLDHEGTLRFVDGRTNTDQKIAELLKLRGAETD